MSAFITDPFYLGLVARSIGFSVFITALTLVVSYPIALFIHRADARWKSLLTIITVSPLLVSAVVRTYGWMLILGDQGFVNGLLKDAGVISQPLRLINNSTGVVIGLTEILMPYMVLALLAGFGRLDRSYEEAALSLGARPWTTFRRVVVPLTAPGIALGCLLCFVLAVSSFITPKLLGGGRVFLLATEIYDQAIMLLNWPLAATMSIIVLVIFGLALVLYTRILRAWIRGSAWKSDATPGASRCSPSCCSPSCSRPWCWSSRSRSAMTRTCVPAAILGREVLSRAARAAVLMSAFKTSLLVAATVTVLSLLIAVPAAYALTRLEFRGRDWLASLFTAPLLLPTIVLGLAMLLVFVRVGLLATFPGLVLAHLVDHPALCAARPLDRAHDAAASIEDAAASLGAPPFTVFRRVTLPMMVPGIVAASALWFLVSFDEVVISLFVVGPKLSTFPVEMYRYVETRTDPLIAAASVVLILGTLGCVLALERSIGLMGALGKKA